jgi:hypothetical protein
LNWLQIILSSNQRDWKSYSFWLYLLRDWRSNAKLRFQIIGFLFSPWEIVRRDILDIPIFSVLTIRILRIMKLNINRSDALDLKLWRSEAKDSLDYSLAFRLRVSFGLNIR